MSQLLLATSTTLHALAMIVFIGHYLLMSLIYLPALSPLDNGGKALGEMSHRSRRWLYISILVFAATGVHLMLVDPNYLGIGNFSNPWALLMLVKHIRYRGHDRAGLLVQCASARRPGHAFEQRRGAGCGEVSPVQQHHGRVWCDCSGF